MKQKLLYFAIIISVLVGFKAWFFIGLSNNVLFIISIVLFLIAFDNVDLFHSTTRKVTFFIISYILTAIGTSQSNLAGFIGCFLFNLPLFVIVFLRDKYRIEVLRLFDKVILFITVISLAGWFLYLTNVPLPHSSLIFYVDGEAQYQFENYFLFLGPNMLLPTLTQFERFSSIFYEPGYYAIILVFLIMYHRFDFKKREVWIYIVALLLTFSLAGYIMFFLMLAGLSLSKSTKGVAYLLLIIASIYGGQELFKDYNGGNNAVNKLIVARMAIEDGNWSGYNRTGETFDDEFDLFVKKGGAKLLTGDLKKDIGKSNVGWKVYMYKFGLLGFIAFIVCVILIYYPYRKKKMCALPAILFIIAFVRGHHVMWFSGFWLLWVGIMNVFYILEDTTEKTLKIKKNKET